MNGCRLTCANAPNPLVGLSDRKPGGAVSLVKAGTSRPPLLPATEEHSAALAGILPDGMKTLEKPS